MWVFLALHRASQLQHYALHPGRPGLFHYHPIDKDVVPSLCKV